MKSDTITNNNKKTILSVQYLRGIASILVVFYHTNWFLDGVYAQENLGKLLFKTGAFGVDLFFIISGFIICLSTEKKETHGVYNFFIRRLFRIYPLLIISVILFYFIIKPESSLALLLKSIIPIHSDYTTGSPFFGFNLLDSAWTITYEISFYMIFAVCILMSHKYRSLLSILSMIIAFIASSYFFNGSISLDAYFKSENSLNYNILSLFYSSMFLDFIYGVIIYICYKHISLKFNIFLKSFPYIMLLLTCLILSQLDLFYGHGPLKWGLISALIVFSCVMYEKSYGIKYRDWLKYLGDISYSIYIVHILVLECVYRFDTHLYPNTSGLTRMLIVFSIVIIVSITLHELIEKKFISIGKKLLK
ncbi:TPA: acyltransferase [Proteus mirabilis]|nr:acyltransferase [Proteus mirabilis]